MIWLLNAIFTHARIIFLLLAKCLKFIESKLLAKTSMMIQRVYFR